MQPVLPYGTGAQQATQDYALEASFLRLITTPAIPRLSNNEEDGSGTGWKVMLSMKPRKASGGKHDVSEVGKQTNNGLPHPIETL